MKIEVHIVSVGMDEDAKQAIRRLGLAAQVDSGRFAVDSESEAFRDILEATRRTSGVAWTPWVTYGRKEMKDSDSFEVWGRKQAAETAADTERNFATLAGIEPIQSGPNLFIKVLRPIHLSRLRGKPNEALRAGDWSEEYILGGGVEEAFAGCGLRGYQTLPVLRTRDEQPFNSFSQIYTDRILPPSTPDLSVVEVKSRLEERPWWKRRLGSLSYEPDELPSGSDFWRTAEPWGSNGLPLWIVSRRVAECFESHLLKGWTFRPVLRRGSPLHRQYVEGFERLFGLLAVNPRNRLN